MSEVNSVASTATTPSMMDNYLPTIPNSPKDGEIVEGTVSAIGRARVYIDIVHRLELVSSMDAST
jgi:hypothetical protein